MRSLVRNYRKQKQSRLNKYKRNLKGGSLSNNEFNELERQIYEVERQIELVNNEIRRKLLTEAYHMQNNRTILNSSKLYNNRNDKRLLKDLENKRDALRKLYAPAALRQAMNSTNTNSVTGIHGINRRSKNPRTGNEGWVSIPEDFPLYPTEQNITPPGGNISHSVNTATSKAMRRFKELRPNFKVATPATPGGGGAAFVNKYKAPEVPPHLINQVAELRKIQRQRKQRKKNQKDAIIKRTKQLREQYRDKYQNSVLKTVAEMQSEPNKEYTMGRYTFKPEEYTPKKMSKVIEMKDLEPLAKRRPQVLVLGENGQPQFRPYDNLGSTRPVQRTGVTSINRNQPKRGSAGVIKKSKKSKK